MTDLLTRFRHSSAEGQREELREAVEGLQRRLDGIPPGSDLHRVDWGSDAALRDAVDAGLEADDFAASNVDPSGDEGYLVGDVADVAEEVGAGG